MWVPTNKTKRKRSSDTENELFHNYDIPCRLHPKKQNITFLMNEFPPNLHTQLV